MNDKTGGPAFPTDVSIFSDGMTLRDYFAAKAMAIFLTSSIQNSKSVNEMLEGVATAAYLAADAMLKARDK